MFTPRPRGLTLRRIEDALERPHDPAERMDADFPVTLRCSKCGKLGHGPRSQIREAMREHMDSDCPARHTRADEPQVTQLLYPRL